MLIKIEKDFYIDIDEIFLVDKIGRNIRIFVKQKTSQDQPFTISSYTKMGKNFLFELDRYLGTL